MVAYQDFVWLSQSADSEDRGKAAHMAALAYNDHDGPADEHAALYAALIGFLDDPSVKVRAALAYGLLHSPTAPRPIMLSLLNDSAIIARAVLQYSPVLIDADLMGLIKTLDMPMLLAVCNRSAISARLAGALLARQDRNLTLAVIRRADIPLEPSTLVDLAIAHGTDPELRGRLLARKELPADARVLLVQKITDDLRGARIVKGALDPARLARLLRNSTDSAFSSIGEREAAKPATAFAAQLILSERLNTRLLLHALITGHVMFFADCIAQLAHSPRDKVFAVLETGSRAALGALLGRCGLGEGLRGLFIRLVMHARAADLADDAAARHFVVTALTEELIVEYDAVIPEELEEAFAYLSEHNVALARKAARGVMAAFADETALPLRIAEAPAQHFLQPAA